jgi:hypothetical protein
VTLRHGFLLASSRSSTVAGDLFGDSYDLALFAGSWDSRCLAVTGAARFAAKQSILISFAENDAMGKEAQAENGRALGHFLAHIGSCVHPLPDVSEDVEKEFDRLWALVRTLVASGRARCFVDLSACPRFYTLGVIAGLISTGLASRIDVLYAEATYPSLGHSPHPSDVPFSIGRWNCIPIPFLRGPFEPSRPRFHVVSVGFEGGKTLRLLEREEATRVAVIYPIPGVTAEYDREVIERNRPVMSAFGVPDARTLSAPAGDAVAAWKAAVRHRVAAPKGEVRYLCCGTKAHSLGLALSAISTRDATVMYNLPERHRFVKVEPTGTFWLYRIKDLTALGEAA